MNDQETKYACMRVPLECRVSLHRAYFEAIKPYQDMLCEIYSVTMPTIVMYQDGRIESKYNFTDSQKETIRLINEAISMAKRAHGFDG